MERLTEVVIDAAILILPVLAALIAHQLRLYIKRIQETAEVNLGDKQFAYLKEVVGVIVRGIAQHPDLDTNEERKAKALEAAIALRDRLKLPISNEDLDLIIESVYSEIKAELAENEVFYNRLRVKN